MATATDLVTGLAYDIEGTGTPVVFVHGLTFDRRTWRPIIEQLDGSVTSIVIDLPAHGDSGGEPAPLENVTERVRRLLEALGVERPVVVGHSMSAAVAGLYASAYPARGIVLVDQAMEILPFAQMLHQIAPMLRGPAFDQVWPNIENSLGLDHLPEPTRTLVMGTHKVRQDVVLKVLGSGLEYVIRPSCRRGSTERRPGSRSPAWQCSDGRPPTASASGSAACRTRRSRSGRATGTSSTSSILGGSRPGFACSSSTATRQPDRRACPGQSREMPTFRRYPWPQRERLRGYNFTWRPSWG